MRLATSCIPPNHTRARTHSLHTPSRLPAAPSAGKSTLLRLIMGREKPMSGRVGLGEHNIVPNYFEQNQAEALDLELTVLETLVRAAPDAQVCACACVSM